MFCFYLFVHFVHFCYSLEYLQGWNHINLHCRDNDNNPVDWWYIYKPPSDAGLYLDTGRNFTYITPESAGRWQVSDKFINANSMLQHTLAPLFRATYVDYLAMMAYTEREADKNTKGSAALGIMMADEIGGLWLGHTVPGLPDLSSDRPTFPENEQDNGHMLMCMSLNLVTLNDIAASLRHVAPKVIEMRIPKLMISSLPQWSSIYRPIKNPLTSLTPKILDFATQEKTLHGTMLVRRPGEKHCLYKAFARTKEIVLDVYGHDKLRKPICDKKYSVRNIDAISLKYPEQVYYINNITDRVGFAISTAAHWQRSGGKKDQYWTCISNLEKQEGNEKGGLILCVHDYNVWISFDNLKIKEPEC